MHVGIVGGGVTGLTIACELTRRGHHVTLFSRGPVGGLAGGFRFPGSPGPSGVYLDKFYHHIFTSDTAIRALIEQHPLAHDLLWLPSTSGLIARGRLWPFRGPLDLLRFTPLGSLWQRLRMGWNLLHFKRTADWRPLDTVRCREFFESRGNLTGYRNLWEPLLKEKFADAFDEIPAAFLWGRIHPRARSRQGAKESLGYLKGGFQRLFVRMVDAVRSGGGQVQTGSLVGGLRPGDRPEVVSASGTHRFDRVVWTASLGRLRRALVSPPDDLARRLTAIQSLAVTQLILVLKRRQTDFYWLNNLDPDNTFGGIIEHTNLVPPEHYGGQHVLYVVNYHRPGDPRFAGRSTQALLEHHLTSLSRTLPNFRREDILRTFSIRDAHASPLYDLGFAARMPPYQGWLPNVDICSMAQVYPYDRNMNHCVENALRYVDEAYAHPTADSRPVRNSSPAPDV